MNHPEAVAEFPKLVEYHLNPRIAEGAGAELARQGRVSELNQAFAAAVYTDTFYAEYEKAIREAKGISGRALMGGGEGWAELWCVHAQS